MMFLPSSLLVTLTIFLTTGIVTAFSLNVPTRKCNSWQQRFSPPRISSRYSIGKTVAASNVQFQRIHSVALSSSDYEFDFSSTIGWENYYKNNPEDRIEWHDSIDSEGLMDLYIPSNEQCNCLMVGCGNSKLPQKVLHNPDKKLCDITLLDTSQTCLDQMKRDIKEEYYLSTRRMSYVCGDATMLSNYFHVGDYYDIIIDKGLTDAFICGEGWTTQVELLFTGASKVLKPKGGRYLLISYNLSHSTKEFLEEIGDEVGLSWQFKVQGSNERVMVSIAHKT